MKPILEIKNLSIDFKVKDKRLRAVDDVTMTINRGEIVGIIGESGSGKSTMAAGILQSLRAPGRVAEGEIIYHTPEGEQVDLLKLTPKEYAKYRWTNITTVFQAAQNVLNPSLRIKDHFIETAMAHNRDLSEEEIMNKAKELFTYVRLEERILDCYPHQLSGGMKQRTVIALSLILEPDVLILDEPTTALDVITQWYIIDILRKIHEKTNITMIFLTHDVSIIGSVVDKLAVLYAGQLAEYGEVKDLFFNPTHPYTHGLMHAIPSLKDDVKERRAIPGYPPNMLNLPNACRFTPRCAIALAGKCEGNKEKTDIMYSSGNNQITRCYSWEKVKEL